MTQKWKGWVGCNLSWKQFVLVISVLLVFIMMLLKRIQCALFLPCFKKIRFSAFPPFSRAIWDFSSNSSTSHWFLQYHSFSISTIHDCGSTEAVMIFAGFQLFLFGLRWPGYQPGQQFSTSVITFLFLLPFSWIWKFGICSSLTLVKRTAN